MNQDEHPAYQAGQKAFREVFDNDAVLAMQPKAPDENALFWDGWNAAHDQQCKGRCPDCRAAFPPLLLFDNQRNAASTN